MAAPRSFQRPLTPHIHTRQQSDNGGPIYDSNWKETGGCPSANRPGMTGPSGRKPYSETCLDFGGAANNHPMRCGCV
jgi:hypothetical protein